jgi:hypothetical protein
MTDDNGPEQTFRDTERNLRDLIETQAREIERLRGALEKIATGEGIGGPDAELQCADIARAALAARGLELVRKEPSQ